MEQRLMSAIQAAKYLGISPRSLHRNGVPYVQIGCKCLYRKELLEEYINNRTVSSICQKINPLIPSENVTAFTTTISQQKFQGVDAFEAALARTHKKRPTQSQLESSMS